MINLIIYIFILAIYHFFLFFEKKLGINVLLFIIPLLGLLYGVYLLLKKDKLITNKYGLLFIIPILLLSISYFIYDNYFFKWFNIIIISVTFFLMYIYTIQPTSDFKKLFEDIMKIALYPLSFLDNFYKIVGEKFNSLVKVSDFSKRKIKSFLIVIPIVFFIIFLLSSADMVFNSLFKNLFNVFYDISFSNIVSKIIHIGFIFSYLGSSIYYIIYVYAKENKNDNTNKRKLDYYTIKLLLTTLNLVYILFDFIQIRSLLFHQGLKNINYAQYARSGFFQLMFISVINIIIILLSKRSDKDTKFVKAMSLLMIGLTFIIIISSFLRMYMYESQYGYTLLRLLVYVILFTETLLLIPTILYIINPKINILKYYVIISYTVYTLLALAPVDYFIAYNNIERYHKTGKIDVYYLENNSTDNIPLLCNLYKELNGRKNNKGQLRIYLKELYKRNQKSTLLEFNLSRERAVKALEGLLK